MPTETIVNPAPLIEAVLFDFGMVLSLPPDPQVWQQMIQLTGWSDESLHRAYWKFRHAYDRGTHTGPEYWQLVAAEEGSRFTPEQVAGLIEADVALWTNLNLPMVEWAGQLQRAGMRTGILSNMPDAMEMGIRAKLDWLSGFDHCTWSHTLKLAKPEEAIYRHSAEGLGTTPGRILFIDDRADNIEAARNFGMQTIQYLDHSGFLAEMESRGLNMLLHPDHRPIADQRT